MQVSDRIGLRVKLNDLHVLMTVVQVGNMSKAAALLNTTQPAISRSIAQLERTVGARLLDRNSQGVEVTEYGKVLLDGGTAVFDDLRQAVKNIKLLADPTAGEIRIACNHFMAGGFVSAVIQRLSRQYPRIVFHVVTAQGEALYRELIERRVDLLVAVRRNSAMDEQVEFEPLFEDQYVIIAGAQNPWARKRKIELAQLVNEPWVLPPLRSVVATLALEAFRTKGLDYPRTIVVTESPTGAVKPSGGWALSRDGFGVSIEISRQANGDQGFARRAANCPRDHRNCHFEESHAQLSRATLH